MGISNFFVKVFLFNHSQEVSTFDLFFTVPDSSLRDVIVCRL